MSVWALEAHVPSVILMGNPMITAAALMLTMCMPPRT